VPKRPAVWAGKHEPAITRPGRVRGILFGAYFYATPWDVT
jgi:hypothetical protein